MSKLGLAIAFSLSLFSLPAHADSWLVFSSGHTVTSNVWTGNSAPIPGENVAAGSTVVPWVQENGDNHPANYTLQENNTLEYTPPAPPSGTFPDVEGFKARVVQDFMLGVLPSAAYINLCKFSSTVSNLAGQPAALQASWSALKDQDAQPGGPLHGDYPGDAPYNGVSIIERIESYATEFNVPLI